MLDANDQFFALRRSTDPRKYGGWTRTYAEALSADLTAGSESGSRLLLGSEARYGVHACVMKSNRL